MTASHWAALTRVHPGSPSVALTQLLTPVQVAEARERTPPAPAHKGQKELSLRAFTLSRTHLAFIIIDNIILGLGIKRPIKTSAQDNFHGTRILLVYL